MDFEKYPFDKHECKQFFGSTGYGVAKMVFEGTHSYDSHRQRPLQHMVSYIFKLYIPTGKLIFTWSQVNPNDIIYCLFVLKSFFVNNLMTTKVKQS
jgi:hypothetical protein